MLTFSEKLLSPYLPLQIPRVNPNRLGLTIVSRRSLVFAKLPQPRERLGIVLNARGLSARHVKYNAPVVIVWMIWLNRMFFRKIRKPENHKGPKLRSGHIGWGRSWGSDHRGIETKVKGRVWSCPLRIHRLAMHEA